MAGTRTDLQTTFASAKKMIREPFCPFQGKREILEPSTQAIEQHPHREDLLREPSNLI